MKKVKTTNDSITFDFKPEKFPTLPGSYLMKDSQNRAIYVVKAKALRRTQRLWKNNSFQIKELLLESPSLKGDQV
jgi:excinuclease UvrABC nuclease subunit